MMKPHNRLFSILTTVALEVTMEAVYLFIFYLCCDNRPGLQINTLVTRAGPRNNIYIYIMMHIYL